MYETANASAPAWFWVTAFAVFPASMVLTWLVGFVFISPNTSEETATWWATKGTWYLPIAGGIAMLALLWYGADRWG